MSWPLDTGEATADTDANKLGDAFADTEVVGGESGLVGVRFWKRSGL